jgi:hypothetical protein
VPGTGFGAGVDAETEVGVALVATSLLVDGAATETAAAPLACPFGEAAAEEELVVFAAAAAVVASGAGTFFGIRRRIGAAEVALLPVAAAEGGADGVAAGEERAEAAGVAAAVAGRVACDSAFGNASTGAGLPATEDCDVVAVVFVAAAVASVVVAAADFEASPFVSLLLLPLPLLLSSGHKGNFVSSPRWKCATLCHSQLTCTICGRRSAGKEWA